LIERTNDFIPIYTILHPFFWKPTLMSDGASALTSSPLDATNDIYETSLHHLYEPTQLTFLKNICGGLLFSFAGNFSLIAAGGCPGLEKSNPGLVSLIRGATFPVGPFLIYFIGASHGSATEGTLGLVDLTLTTNEASTKPWGMTIRCGSP